MFSARRRDYTDDSNACPALLALCRGCPICKVQRFGFAFAGEFRAKYPYHFEVYLGYPVLCLQGKENHDDGDGLGPYSTSKPLRFKRFRKRATAKSGARTNNTHLSFPKVRPPCIWGNVRNMLSGVKKMAQLFWKGTRSQSLVESATLNLETQTGPACLSIYLDTPM